MTKEGEADDVVAMFRRGRRRCGSKVDLGSNREGEAEHVTKKYTLAVCLLDYRMAVSRRDEGHEKSMTL